MSHTLNIKTEIRDKHALLLACERLGLKAAVEGSHKLYQSTEEGLAVALKGWRYPVVIKEDGSIAYDNYEGSWGSVDRLNELKSMYGLEKAKLEARKLGYSCYETANQAGEMQLRIRVGG